MNERAIFQEALDYSDPAQRQAYLDRACGNDVALRARIEALLRSHEDASQFLQVPAAEQLRPPGNWSPQTLDMDEAGARSGGPPDDASCAASELSFLTPSSKPGSLGVLGHYEILQLLGQGAFGLVFKAFDQKLHRQVAIKVMNPQLAATSPPRKRFLREARSAAAIKHENIVQVYSVEEHPLPYLVMEYVDGLTLKDKLDNSGPLDIAEILHLGRQMAAGLAAAHAQGLIHRDIKPGNILIEAGAEQKVKITDFGLARAADDATMTRTGVISGTPMYMAPEQALGLALDQRADLFSLGSVLYQLASGRPPFRGANAIAVLKRVTDETPRPIREILADVPDWLCAIIAKLHAKNPEERFQSAKEVADLLARCQARLQQHGRVELPGDLVSFMPLPPSTARPEPTATELIPNNPTPVQSNHVPQRRRWAAVAAVLLALCAGLSLTEATDVTHVRGTVIRLFSPDGTLVVEVDDPTVSVSIDGEEMVITGTGAKEIRLRPGQYQVLASKEGKVVSQELITVTKNGRQVVRVSREKAEKPSAGVEDADRRAAEWVLSMGGNVHIDDNVTHVLKAAELPKTPFRFTGFQLRNPKVVDADLHYLKDCKHLSRIDLGFTGIGDAGLEHLPKSRPLTSLGLLGTRVTDAGLARLSPSNELTALSIGSPFVTDAGVAKLGNYQHLTYLWLNSEKLTDGALLPFKDCQNLIMVDIQYTSIGDQGIAQLRGCKNLAAVWAKHTKMTERGVTELQTALPKCKVDLNDVSLTLDRRAAEWVLSVGGEVVISANGVESAVPKGGKLPDTPFRVVQIFLNETKIRDGDLAPVKGLSSLRVFMAWHHFGNPGLTDGCVEYLLESPELDTLSVAGAGITDAGIERLLSLKKLEKLDVGRTKITDEGVKKIARLAYLKHLTLHGTAVTDAGVKHLQDATSIERLSLESTQTTNSGLQHLRKLVNLETLTVKGTKISGEGLIHLQALPKLKHLCLDATAVTNESLARLQDFPGLLFLALDLTQISDDGVANLGKIKGLTTVLLRQTRVTAAGAKELAAALPHCKIEWDGGVIDPKQAVDPDRRAAAFLLSIPRDFEVAVQVNDVDRWIGKVADLPAEPFRLTAVFVEWAAKLDDQGLAYFQGCKHIKILRIWGTQATEKGLAHFRACQDLRELSLNGDTINDDALALFKACPLTSLHVQSNQVTNAGLAHFRGSQQLTTLALAHLRITDEAMAYFKDNKKLKALSLADFPLTDAGLAHFQGCKDLEALHVFWTQVSDAGLIHFKDCKKLKTLDCNRLALVTDTGLAYFKDCTELGQLNLGGTGVSDKGLAHLANLKNLTFLRLENTKVTDAGLVHLKTCKLLGELHLWQTRITGTGFVHLKELPSLTRLFLAECPVTDDGVDALCECLKLRALGVTKTRLSAAGVRKLADALPQCQIDSEHGKFRPGSK